jgi:solute:Na+ symporter, SSS family
MHLSLLDIFVVTMYVALMLAVSQFGPSSDDAIVSQGPGYVPRKRAVAWWAIGTSLIAANISAEQIIGMSGSAYAFGLAIATYEWTAALVLVVVGKYFLPIFLKNDVHTMPEFLCRRFGQSIQMVMAALWIVLYVFVNLTASLWLGALAVHTIIPDLSLSASLIVLGLFAGNYALYVGLKEAEFSDVLQVAMLVTGGLLIVYFALERISGGSGAGGLVDGFVRLSERLPDHFHMILKPDNPYYKYAPGLAMVAGGMWVMHFSYWGFNQFISQRALESNSIRQAQRGVVLAAFLKLLIPIFVVLPGIAAVGLVQNLGRPDEAYPELMLMLPSGFKGFVFVALVAAIISSMGSTLSSIAVIFSNDFLKNTRHGADERFRLFAGRFAAIAALVVAMLAAMPILGHFDQAFQYIQEFTGFLTPGVLTIFLVGMFWSRADEAGALAAVVGSVVVSSALRVFLPELPFIDRIGVTFLVCMGLAVVVSLLRPRATVVSTIRTDGIDYSTDATFNIASGVIIAILVALYAIWW